MKFNELVPYAIFVIFIIAMSELGAFAQTSGTNPLTVIPPVNPTPGINYTIVSNGVTTTQTGGTLSATTGSFGTSPVAAAASPFGSRRGFTFVNTSSATEYVYLGVAATPTQANSIPVPAGQSLSTWVAVPQDEIQAMSPTIANATYVLLLQQ